MGSIVVGGAWWGVMRWEEGTWCENCGEYMGIDGLTLHRGAASGAVTIKGAICNRTWCRY